MTTKQNTLDNPFSTEIANELTIDGHDILILDLASLDDDGWQVRDSYVSVAGSDDYIQVTHGDGYNGWGIGESGFPSNDKILQHLKISEADLKELMDAVDSEEHLNSVDWSMLETLKDEAGICRHCNLTDGDHESYCQHYSN